MFYYINIHVYKYIFVHLLSNNSMFNFANVPVSKFEMSSGTVCTVSLIDISHSSRIKQIQ